MSRLLETLSLRSIKLRNRIGVSPMCQYSSVDGFANDWHLVHLGARASGGAGMVMTEATAVSPEGRISPDDLGIWKDEHIEMLARIARFIKGQGAVAAMQLAHAGRKASTLASGGSLSKAQGAWESFAPSPIPFAPDWQTPSPLDEPGMQKVVADFVAAAQRALAAGFEIIEIHAAHGYLLHQFLSPISNHRQDAWGGSLENRARFVREIARAVRAAWPQHLPLLMRVSATDWMEPESSWTLDQTVQLCRWLKDDGVDLIDTSSGGMVPHAKIKVGPGYQVPFAQRIRADAGIPTAAVGMISEAAQAELILEKGQADLILLAREYLRDPNFALHAAKALGDDIAWPKQYFRAKS
jgi:2,4-dienoyl-CoA reductase-like NADH-dependent reductase (Old Yellow Enzyme family)